MSKPQIECICTPLPLFHHATWCQPSLELAERFRLRLRFSATHPTALLTHLFLTERGGLSLEKTVFAMASPTLAHYVEELGACGNRRSHHGVKGWDVEERGGWEVNFVALEGGWSWYSCSSTASLKWSHLSVGAP